MSLNSFFSEDHKEVAVHIKDKEWKNLSFNFTRLASKIINYVLHYEKIENYEISITFMSDEAIQKLNSQYRENNKPTNVLSFIYNVEPLCGDIILAYGTIARESQEQGKSFQAHLTHLIVHGALHLLGYDHETNEEALIMEGLEKKLLGYFNIPNPYGGEERNSV